MNIFKSYVSICAFVVAGTAFAVDPLLLPGSDYEATSSNLPDFPNLSFPQPKGKWGCRLYKTCSDKS
jgi:hypothetical protein